MSGCILGSEHPSLDLAIPDSYREAPHPSDAAVPALDWWRGFRSAELTALMEDAQIYNLDIAVAVASIPEEIRGYGHIKEASLVIAREREAQLLSAFKAPVTEISAARAA